MAVCLIPKTKCCRAAFLPSPLGSFIILFILFLSNSFVPELATAGELFGLYGATNEIDTPHHSFAYQVGWFGPSLMTISPSVAALAVMSQLTKEKFRTRLRGALRSLPASCR